MDTQADRLLSQARAWAAAGEAERALAAFSDYLCLRPQDAEVWSEQAGLQAALHLWDRAETSARRALALDPGHVSAGYQLGLARLRQGDPQDAAEQFRHVMSRHPEHAEACVALAECHLQGRDWSGAEQLLRGALPRLKGEARAHQILTQILYGEGRWDAYLEELDRFSQFHPDAPRLGFERAYLNLLQGRMPMGWQQYEDRLAEPGLVTPARSFEQPRWQGESFQGKTILVHYEQGFGDTLMLVRYLPLVKARGGRVLLLVQPQMAYLMTTLQGPDHILPQGDPLPDFDLHISLFSLPAVFQTRLDTIPAEVPYLGIPRSVPNRDAIAHRLAASEGRIRIGLVWGGNPGHARDWERSVPVSLLLPLGQLPNVAWHSFQRGRTDRPDLPGLVDLEPLLQTFSDSAYALSGMDLLITVDTAIAHLAGALGVPTLLLITHAPDFRWMLHRSDSPWYPTMRIYRQPGPGCWAPVLDQVLRDLSGAD